MLINKKELISLEWKSVEHYLKEENSNATQLAILEAEKVFIRTINAKGYKAKNIEEKISLAVKEIKRPEVFLKTREKVLALRDKVGYNLINDPYSGGDILNIYREAIEDLLFGVIENAKYQKIKFKLWPFYFYLYARRKKITRFVICFLAVILLMLFIADTDLGRNIFNFIIDKIHFILKVFFIIVFVLFTLVFFITLSLVYLESKTKKKMQNKKETSF